jgi:hypothetical protein
MPVDGRLSTLLGHATGEDEPPARRETGPSVPARQLALSANREPSGDKSHNRRFWIDR